MTKLAILALFTVLAYLIPGLAWIGHALLTVVELGFAIWFAMFLVFMGVLVGRRAIA